MVAGFTAFVLIAYNGLIDPPGSGAAEIGITSRSATTSPSWLRRESPRPASGARSSRRRAPSARRPARSDPVLSPVGVISHDVRSGTKPDRNLALELVRVTEAAALAAARWVGRGDKEAADGAAVDAMRLLINTVPMDGIVVIGEGEKDEAPMLFNGEEIGDGSPPAVDIAVDPLEGTRLCANGRPGALAVIALAERGAMFDPGPCFYMEKLVAGKEVADAVDIEGPIDDNVRASPSAEGQARPR